MNKQFDQTWDLESIFPGGSESKEVRAALDELKATTSALGKEMASTKATAFVNQLEPLAGLTKRLGEAGAFKDQIEIFIGCLRFQDVNDVQASQLFGRVQQIGAELANCSVYLEDIFKRMDDELWASFLENDKIKPISFAVNEIREMAQDRLSSKEEELINSLSVDGHHGWFELYKTVVSETMIEYEQHGESKQFSIGQVNNLLNSPDMDTRRAVSVKWEKAWSGKAQLYARILNHLAGYRIALYQKRGWDSILGEALKKNRMQPKTLEVIWAVVEENKPILVKFLQRKARLLGVDKLSWYDVFAPLPTEQPRLTFDSTARFIIEQFGSFDPRLGEFAQMAFDKRWIEAEDRPGKDPGAYGAGLPLTGESRIFMTFSGVPINRAILAHELGHAYHSYVMRDMPYLVRSYPPNVAETAAIFAEAIVADAAVRQASDKETKIALIHDKVQRAVSNYMGIQTSFLFETRFYEQRKQSALINAEQLCELMVQAQKDAFLDSLETYHPHAWCSRGHFYFTRMPFYNFPYTFGYLFSTGVYAKAQAEGADFGGKYVSLLRDTGRMSVEDLAQRHLDVDLSKPDFFQSSADLMTSDVREFLRLTE